MSAGANLPAKAFDGAPFDEFYDRTLPVVYGYLLRLCGGDREEAWDLTQDSWITVVDRVAKGQTETASVGFLLSVARSRYLDSWRRQRRLQRKLRLVWAGARESESAEVSAGKVLDHLSVCSDQHRVVLMLAYVDDLPIAEIAQMLGSSVSSTYSLLARARDELRSHPHRRSEMTDHYDEMRVSPDPSQAEDLRQRLHARMASVSQDDHERRSHLHLDTDRLDPEEPFPMKEIDVTLDSPTSETRDRRRMVMAAAAVVAVIGAAGIAVAITNANADDDETPAATAVATIAPTTSVAPTTTVAPPTTVAPRPETVRFAVANDIPVTFTVPADWTVLDGWAAYKDLDTVGVLFDDVSNIYADGCHWVLVDPPVGPTVDDLVAAWASVPELAATEAVDVTVDGYSGKKIELTVPDYPVGECRGPSGQFGLWQVGDPLREPPGYWAQDRNQHLQLWILDVDGTRLVIAASDSPDSSPQDRAALEEVMASIQIG